jgi:small subunit ribosomal protein S14
MKYLVEKDKKRRQIFEFYERKRLLLKALSIDKRLPLSFRLFYKIKFQAFIRNSSKTRIKNRCIFTGRARSVIRHFRMSRLQVRDLYIKGLLYGVRKSSW